MLSWKTKLLAFASLFGIFALVVAYVLEFKYFSNTIGVGKLIGWSALAGALLGALAARPLALRETDWIGQLRLWLGLVILGALFGPLFGSWLNRLPSRSEITMVPALFIEEKPFAQKPFGVLKDEKIEPDGYYIFVLYQESIRRFQSPIQQFSGVKKNEVVQLPIRMGFLRFRWVDFY